MTGITRGKAAELIGVNAETIRYYERRKLIPKPPRSAGGYRIYTDEHLERIRFIRRAQDLGFTLNEIDELLQLRADELADCSGVQATAKAKLIDVKGKIRDLRRIAETLESLTSACPGEGPPRDCPILEALREPDD